MQGSELLFWRFLTVFGIVQTLQQCPLSTHSGHYFGLLLTRRGCWSVGRQFK